MEVSWDFADVLFVLFTYLATIQVAAGLLDSPEKQWKSYEELHANQTETDEGKPAGDETTSQHPVLQLLTHDRSTGTFILVFLVTAISAPLWEEFLFRLVLLGWMAKQENSLSQKTLKRWPVGVFSLLFTSLLFALAHFRWNKDPVAAEQLYSVVTIMGITNFVALGISLVYLRVRHDAKLIDFGFSPQHLIYDLKTAAIAFLAAVVPILFLQVALQRLLPSGFAPDPIPLFFLAIVLGILFLRTRRTTSCVALHFYLNTFSLLMALATIHFAAGN